MPLLFNVEIPLGRRPFLPGERQPVVHSKEVAEVRQTGTVLCWAACIAAENARLKRGEGLAAIAAREAGCAGDDCRTDPVDDRCDVPVDPADLKRVWQDNGFPGLEYVDGQIGEERLEEHLAKHGPVQIALGNYHLVMLDRWMEGVYGSTWIWFMDPMSGRHFDMSERALRTNPSDDAWPEWTGTVTGLAAEPPAGNPFPHGGGWWLFTWLISLIKTIWPRR